MSYLFDASSIIEGIKIYEGAPYYLLKGNYVLDLTIYEVGNALWKESYLLKRIDYDEAAEIMHVFSKLFRKMHIIRPSNLSLVLKLAQTIGITFYDSSYIVAASENDLIFVTEDRKLYRKINDKRPEIENMLEYKVVLKSIHDLLNNTSKRS